MKNYKDKNIFEFLLGYDKIDRNIFEDDFIHDIFGKTLEKHDSTLKKDNSKFKKDIVFNNTEIGGLYGTRPTTTDIVALNLLKNEEVLKEYINMLTTTSSKHESNFDNYFQVRVTIVEGQFSAALLRIPPFVIGDGSTTIKKLIEIKNSERKQSAFFRNTLFNLNNNQHLEEESISRILGENEIFILSQDLNVLNGAESLDITNNISGNIIKKLVNYIASVPGLYTTAIDIKLNQLNNNDFELVKVHSSINTLIHYLPYKGATVHVLEQYVKSLITLFKRDNDIKLSEEEEVFLSKYNTFLNDKKEYENKLLKIDTTNYPNISNELIKEVKKLKSYISLKRNAAQFSDSIYVDYELFGTDISNEKLNINSKDVLRLLKPNSSTKLIADNALNNIIIPFPKFDSVKFDEKYYYTDKSKKYGASYQLYIQSFRACAELLLEFEKTKNINYLLKVKEMIYAWIDYVSKGTNEKMVWYDHPTANRTQTIIHFLYLASEENIEVDEKLFRSVLIKHGEILMDDSVYKNNNHGLMMDKALLVLGNILNEEKFFTKGYYRAIETFWYSFSSKGTHLENSPDYHNMVVRMYKEIEGYLNVKGKSFGKTILGYIGLADNYLDIIKKPNNKLPALGDSGNTLRRTPKSYLNFCDLEAGIGVLQYEGIKPFYSNFVCGYSSQVHKHKDDLSINLNYNGIDFIVDSGKFNYNSKSPIRKYITSKDAHSSFTLKQHNYTINDSNRFTRNVEIKSFNFTDRVSFIKGSHRDYKSVDAELLRTIVQIQNQPILIIIDDCIAENNIEYKQNFNLHEKVDVSIDSNKVHLSNSGEVLTLKQFNSFDNMNIVDGDVEKPIALNTIGFGKVAKTKQIMFEKKTNKESVFTTAIYDENEIESLDISYENKRLFIIINNEEFILDI